MTMHRRLRTDYFDEFKCSMVDEIMSKEVKNIVHDLVVGGSTFELSKFVSEHNLNLCEIDDEVYGTLLHVCFFHMYTYMLINSIIHVYYNSTLNV